MTESSGVQLTTKDYSLCACVDESRKEMQREWRLLLAEAKDLNAHKKSEDRLLAS